ncbi:hypothetical protein FXO37_06668 [Capsicum annuum]|nr:hypothetical protein FXO37_06668 [Capsicum annuum]
MDNYILIYFHHGGNVVASPKLSYKGEVDVFVVVIDKDHYSLFEFLSYAKGLGYSNIKEFCCQHTYGEELVLINSDWELLNFVKDLKDGPPACIDEDDIGSDGNEGRGLDEDLNGIESDVPSADSDVEIPDEDGEAGIDKGFQDIQKKNRYIGRLGGDEEFIDSSDCDSIDSTDLVNEDVIVGADLPRRRRSSKIRFDDDCGGGVFELGMIFNGPKEFRKILGRDLQLGTGAGLTVMADMQKDFLAAVFDLLPNAKLEFYWRRIRKGLRLAKFLWNVDVGFEIGEGEFRHTVDLSNRICSHRTWQLRGIPCQHTICALYHVE